MTHRSRLALLAGAVSLAAAPGVFAGPPSLILTGQIARDLSADGTTAVGAIYDASLQKVIVHTYTLGVGALNTGAVLDNDPLHCSADAHSLTYSAYDLQNVAGLGTDRYAPRLWTLSGGELNLGKPPAGSSCDAFTFTPGDISGNGRYLVGGGYTQNQCGPYRAFRYDSALAAWEQLPVSISPPPLSAPARATRADAVSADGNVIVGYDENYDASLTQQWRGAAVWVKSGATWTETILDPYANHITAVSADGSTLVGRMSQTTMLATFGTTLTTPIRWTRSGSTWIPENLGGDPDMQPIAVSADGSTVVGYGGSDSGFIWRANINGGTPIALEQYVVSLGGSFPGLTLSAYSGSPIYAISNDGNTLLVSGMDSRNPCLPWFPGAILALNGAPCDPANIVLGPVSHFNPAGPSAEPFGMTFNCIAGGSWTMNFQWQKETTPGSGVWTNLVDDHCSQVQPNFFSFRGTTTMQLRIGALGGLWSGRYRCVVTNGCGSATSAPFTVGLCHADVNCDGFVDGSDSDLFNNAFESTDPDQQLLADYNGDGFVDGTDADLFNNDFESGC